jgi:SAM-dependent methyltransferase
MRRRLLVLLISTPLLPSLAATSLSRNDDPGGIIRIRRDADRLAPLVKSELSRGFLEATTQLPTVAPRTLYQDPVRKVFLTESAAEKLDPSAFAGLKKVSADETLYYNTKYGSPLAYVLPLEQLALAGFKGWEGRKVLDFGYGGVGPLRLMATLGADAVGVDVDPLLPALYSAPSDQGVIETAPGARGRVTLIDGRFPFDPTTKANVGQGYDLILSKNTLKRGYVHPDRPTDKRRLIDLGVDDATFVSTLYSALKPGGRVLIYNLCPAPSSSDKPFIPAADGRSPFDRSVWEAAGFRVLAFDKDDSTAARALARALEWDRGEGAMDPEKDLFALFTLVEKPAAS